MNDRLSKFIIFGLLIICLIWGYFSFFGDGSETVREQPQPMQNITYAPDNRDQVNDRGLSDNVLEDYGKRPWGRDPFYHEYWKATAPSVTDEVRLHLLGIIYRELNAQALINGQILREGDTLQNYRVLQIARDHVILKHGSEMVKLWVMETGS